MAAVVACGGNRSESTGSFRGSDGAGVAIVSESDELPSTTYAGGDLAAWNTLQVARVQCGFGPLEQDARLDAAARAHGEYLLAEGTGASRAIGHIEENHNNPHYSGLRAAQRAQGSGYGAQVTELLTASIETHVFARSSSEPSPAERGARDTRALLNTVAHLSGAMGGSQVAGLAALSAGSETVSGEITTRVVNHRLGVLLGRREPPQLLGAGKVASYPCQGSSGIAFAFAPATEEPNPFPEIKDRALEMGPPIYLRADAGSALVVDAFTLRDADGLAQPVRTDAAPRGNHEFFMVPMRKLKPGARYLVRIEGRAAGAPFIHRFEFQTRS